MQHDATSIHSHCCMWDCAGDTQYTHSKNHMLLAAMCCLLLSCDCSHSLASLPKVHPRCNRRGTSLPIDRVAPLIATIWLRAVCCLVRPASWTKSGSVCEPMSVSRAWWLLLANGAIMICANSAAASLHLHNTTTMKSHTKHCWCSTVGQIRHHVKLPC